MFSLFSFTIFYFIFLTCCQSRRLYDTPITYESKLRFTAPSAEARAQQNLPSSISAYLEDDWSKSIYEPGCSDDNLQIVPIYFWPGERINLACAMCDIAFVLNGKVKNWGWARNIPEFLENPQKAVVSDSSKWTIVSNIDYQEDPIGAGPPKEPSDYDIYPPVNPHLHSTKESDVTQRKRPDNMFYQHDGELSILYTSAATQGVYFCYDRDSLGSISYFYVLMAMVPPVLLGSSTTFTDGCVSKNLYFPHHNWRYHFLPAVRIDRTPTCRRSHQTFSTCYHKYKEMYTNVKSSKNLEMDCNIEHCVSELRDTYDSSGISLNVAVELRWDSWTGCRDGVPSERREGHCYLVRNSGKTIPEDVTESVDWLSMLNSLFDHEPFHSEGIRLYSSLIPWLILGKSEQRLQCLLTPLEQAKYDDVFKNIILKAMGYDGKTDSLDNPFQACMTMGQYNVNEGTLGFNIFNSIRNESYGIGTYMVETRSCS